MGFRLFGKRKLEDTDEHEDCDSEEVEESKPQKSLVPFALSMKTQPESDIRSIGLYGEVEEKKVSEVIAGLIALASEETETDEPVDPENPDGEKKFEVEPIELYISTPGGNADDMLSLYDMMRVTKEICEIHTIGIGKVMSAGVLLLAAGTKGKRRIGKNCRVMIHSVIGGNAGSYHNLENEMQEIRHIQDTYIRLLAAETNMTMTQLKKMINKKVNVYLSAEEAVKLGIADEVF
jgi:ATP-dependent Clp protease protease subunit